MNRAFKYEVAKIVIDKLLLAILILLFGYFINVYLEKDKSINSFNLEINKLKVEKISEVWERVYLLVNLEEKAKLIETEHSPYLFESLIYVVMLMAISEAEKGEGKNESDSEIANRIKKNQIDKKRAYTQEITELRIKYTREMKEVIAKNRFWLTKEEYDLINTFSSKSIELYLLKAKNKTDDGNVKITRIEVELNELIQNIENYRIKYIESF